ncbi:unnamed protein product [Boreogadus saida]
MLSKWFTRKPRGTCVTPMGTFHTGSCSALPTRLEGSALLSARARVVTVDALPVVMGVDPSQSGWPPFLCLRDISQEGVKEDCSYHMMKITVINPNVAQENQDPVYMAVIIEGTEVLEDCVSVCVTLAFCSRVSSMLST